MRTHLIVVVMRRRRGNDGAAKKQPIGSVPVQGSCDKGSRVVQERVRVGSGVCGGFGLPGLQDRIGRNFRFALRGPAGRCEQPRKHGPKQAPDGEGSANLTNAGAGRPLTLMTGNFIPLTPAGSM